MTSVQSRSLEYVLGHSDQELERLERQGQFLSGLTRDLMVRAGIGPGMRVLDFGAGAGDVAILASELVGPGGEVVAIERSADAVAHARARLEKRGIGNIRVVHGDETTIPQAMGEKPFDALVGRLVLVHQKDPVDAFVNLARFVRPGGIVAFHEIDPDGQHWAVPALPLLARVLYLITETFKRNGGAPNISAKMVQAFDRAGITNRRVVREGLVEGPDSHAYEFLSRTVRSLMPAMVKQGVVAENEIDLDALPDNLKGEAVRAQAHFTPVYIVAAFGRTGGG